MSSDPAWVALRERRRQATRTAVHAVEVAVLLSQLHPLDRRTYIEEHRADWDREAEMPESHVLLKLAERIPGCRRLSRKAKAS